MSEDFNYIVRIHGANLDGTKKLAYALSEIKGMGIHMGRALVREIGLDPDQRLGGISGQDVRKIEEHLEDSKNMNIPSWIVNRRKDLRTGEDLHLTGSDVDLRVKEDIERMKETRSWKGERHRLGLKVRGQHTKTTARKGRSVGVSRKRIKRRREEELEEERGPIR